MKRKRKLYLVFQKGGSPSHLFNLSWTHCRYLLPLDNENERNYYINRCIQNNLSVRGLINEIKTKSFDRLSYANKKSIKLITDKETSYGACPILININSKEKMSEQVLKKYILKELEHFFLELGTGFTFAISENKLSYDNKNYYVDLLLFNYKLNRFIVCESKLNSVNAKDIGQTLNYIKIIDKTLKEKNHKNTIGIIISKRNDKFILEYVSDLSLMLTTYKLENNLKKSYSINLCHSYSCYLSLLSR